MCWERLGRLYWRSLPRHLLYLLLVLRDVVGNLVVVLRGKERGLGVVMVVVAAVVDLLALLKMFVVMLKGGK